ncbi:MAG: acyltransferase [Chloroflexota bacterium]|nr:acyltransferase [Chloroflexota bacterium]
MDQIKMRWAIFWMHRSGQKGWRRLAMRLAAWGQPPYKARRRLARWGQVGFISPDAQIDCPGLRLSQGCFIDDDVTIFQHPDGGAVDLGERVHIYRGCIVETGPGGSLTVGSDTHIQARCQFTAFAGPVEIGARVQIAPNCCFYPYDHSFILDEDIASQPLQSKGGIVIGDGAWLGAGVTVLDGVTIGKGAVIGAGAVVTRNIPDNGIAVGVPAKVVGERR